MNEPEFDFGESRKQAEEGMEKARDAHRTFEWAHDMGIWYMRLAPGDEFTADDAVKACGLPDEGQNNNNAVGSWFSGMANAKFIQWTGKTYKSERIDRHTGLNRVWRKLK